ncbi:hypothetical protein [Pseudophaeobacter sp.]|uniref:hypothetical protein n=1 Tax=Pseudophaeobacter sp. TaxID=1971739 RepID=UPI0040598500
MKPGFALSLSAEGIVLLHRAAGGWRNVATVPLDTADLAAALVDLRNKGEALEPDGHCKLIIPNEQIRYLSIETGISDLESRHRLARAALEGATPYPVDELAFDLSEQGSQTHIAAVARETLAEAESFALEHGFTPASFVAMPGDMEFLGEPFFGPAPSLGHTDVEPDGIAVVDIGPADVPAPKPAPEPAAKTDAPAADKSPLADPRPAKTPAPAQPAATATTQADVADDQAASGEADPAETVSQDSTPIAGFSSRRRKSDRPAASAAPALSGVERGAAGAPPKAPAVGAARNASKTPPAAKPAPAAPVAPAAAQANGKIPAAPGPGVSPTATAPSTNGPSAKGPTTQNLGAVSAAPGANPATAGKASPATALLSAKAPRAGSASAQPASPAADKSAAQTVAQATGSLEKTTSKGKPRYLGLLLTTVLLLIMATVAAFAVFSDGGLFFSSERAPQEDSRNENFDDGGSEPGSSAGQDAAETSDPATAMDSPTALPMSVDETEPVAIAPQVSALPGQPDPGVVELARPGDETAPQTEMETQASTGQAVLDTFEGEEATQTDAALSAAALYAATGIWQQVPQIAEAPALVSLNDIYIASIDNSDLSQDAVALPTAPVVASDPAPDVLSSPATAGSDFDLDARGLVTATPEGTLNPDGVMIYLGRPAVVPPPTPQRPDSETRLDEAENTRLASLSLLRPRPRPGDLVEQAERALLGGLSRAELAKIRPRTRPASLKTAEQESQPVSALAVASSVQPRTRPANFANLVDRATRSRENDTAAATATTAAATVAPRTVSPSIPSSASVARQATVTNAINLRRLNLIGVSGKPSNRQALIRLPSGRYRKVQVGDRLDGGTVVAIGDSQLQYQKRGTNTTLELPGN